MKFSGTKRQKKKWTSCGPLLLVTSPMRHWMACQQTGRIATAYNAALQAAKMAIACAGYRVTGAGHHRISFEVVRLAIGKAADPYSDYFDRCRRKRNVIDYDDAFVATETEALEIVAKAKQFVDLVEQWIAKAHPSLKA